MSPFSKVEMSPFVVVKKHLQNERCGAGGAPTTEEPTRADAAGSNPTSSAKNAETTPGVGTIGNLRAAGETAVQSLPRRGSRGPDFETTQSALEQSLTGKDNQQSKAVITFSLS